MIPRCTDIERWQNKVHSGTTVFFYHPSPHNPSTQQIEGNQSLKMNQEPLYISCLVEFALGQRFNSSKKIHLSSLLQGLHTDDQCELDEIEFGTHHPELQSQINKSMHLPPT